MASLNGRGPVVPSRVPAAGRLGRRVRQARARPRGRSDRRRRGDRRRRAGGASLRQPAAPAARGRPGADGEARRGAGGGDREGQGVRGAQPERRDDAPVRAEGAVPRRPRVRMALARDRRQGQRLLDARTGPEAAAQADPAAVPQPRQPHGQRGRAVPLAGHAGRGRRRLHPHRDERSAAAGLRWGRARDPLRRQGPRQGRPGARQLRARLRRDRARHRAGRGNLGASDRRRDQGVRARRRPRAAGMGARGQGGVGGPKAARPGDPHARLAAPLRRPSGTSSAARGSIPRVRTACRSGSWSGSTTPTPPSRPTTSSSCSRPPSSCAGSSRAASAWRGARRRSPRAATGRCPSPRRRGW